MTCPGCGHETAYIDKTNGLLERTRCWFCPSSFIRRARVSKEGTEA